MLHYPANLLTHASPDPVPGLYPDPNPNPDPHAQFTDRKVSHPLFKNVSQATAAEQLAGQEPGACVFRPSVRGQVALGLTIKLHDGVDGQPLFYHTDLDESGKVRGSPWLELGLGLGSG